MALYNVTPAQAFHGSVNDCPTLHFNFRSRRCVPKTGKGTDACSQGVKMKNKKTPRREIRTRTLFPILYAGVLLRVSPARPGVCVGDIWDNFFYTS